MDQQIFIDTCVNAPFVEKACTLYFSDNINRGKEITGYYLSLSFQEKQELRDKLKVHHIDIEKVTCNPIPCIVMRIE